MKLPYDASRLPRFPWLSPAANPYKGSFDTALVNYANEIPPEPLGTLRTLVRNPAEHGKYVVIDKKGIHSPDGVYSYGHLRMMHFGDGQVLKAVLDTGMWPDGFSTGALVFQSAQYCICIPTVCRNVSIATLLRPAPREVYVERQATRSVPEPSSLALVAAAGIAAWVIRRRTKMLN